MLKMETDRLSKKTRSYGGPSRGSRASQVLPTCFSENRPQAKNRVRPISLEIPQAAKQEPPQGISKSTRTGGPWKASQISKSAVAAVPSPYSKNDEITMRECDFEKEKESGAFVKTTVGRLEEVQEVSIAIVGAPSVGKSTFVRCALDLKAASISRVASKKVSLEGEISIVRLFELRLEELHFTEEQGVRWPERLDDHIMPKFDGVLALYDVMDQSSVARLPHVLSESIRT